MEHVDILDIDGYKWEIQDAQARKDIAELKSSQGIFLPGRVEVSLRQGYTASDVKLLGVCKMGKLIFGVIRITNIAGVDVGSNKPISVIDFPFNPAMYTECVAVDTNTNAAYRMQIFQDKRVTIVSSEKLENGNNELTAPFIIFET